MTRRLSLGLAGIAAVLLSTCGGGSSFKPAVMPANVCDLLAQADAQTILPTAGPGARQINAETADFWSIACFWLDSPSSSGKDVGLLLGGALTTEGARQLDEALTAGPTPGSAPAMAVSGLGDEAAYIDNPGSLQLLRARVGSYLLELRAQDITPDVTEAQLHPLVAKAIGAL